MNSSKSYNPMDGTILLVDDQPESIDVIKAALYKFFTIKVATRGEIAIQIADSGGVDLILMDIVMPGMDGYEVCRHLKRNLSTRNIPIIFLTSKDDPEDEAIGLELGAVDFIRKPSSPSVVLTRSRNTIAYQKAKNDLLEKNDELQYAIKVRESEIKVRQRIEETLQQKQEELSQKSDLLETILGSLQQGLVACDKDMKLIVCNRRFRELRGVPEEKATPGTPFAGWVRYNEEIGDFSHESSGELVARPRMQDEAARSRSHNLERSRPDGTVIMIQGGELPSGGFVSTFTDITKDKQKEAELRKLSVAVEHSPISVIVTDANGIIEYVNDKFTTITGYATQDVLGKKTNILSSGSTAPEKYKEMWTTLLAGKLWHGELLNRKKNGDIYWKEISISPIKDDRGQTINFVSTGEDITNKKKLEEERRDAMSLINSSIKYASRIQRSILPPEEILKKAFLEHFVLWEPRDTVGGDMYWLRSWGSGTLILLGDCTGHGVPGAFMTLISNGALDEAYLETPPGDPATLLQRMHQLIQFSLGQDREDKENDDEGPNDGIEVGACYLNGSEGTITFAGARFDLFIMKNGEVSITKGTKAGLGYRSTPKEIQFTNHEIKISSDHTYYMASDGLIDQIGGDTMRGFGKKRFKSMLVSMADVPLADQNHLILQALEEYQGNQNRRDDVTVIGFKGFEAAGQISNRDLVEMDHTMLVDFKPIDDDHKRLFGLINKLNDAIVRGQNKVAAVDILDDLISYTAWHFRHEERLMQMSSYPNSAEHKATHGKLIDQALKIQQDINENDADVSTDLMVFLWDWLNGHIHNVDKHLADYLNSVEAQQHLVEERLSDKINMELPGQQSVEDFFILDDSLLVGFGPIDDDHKKLVSLINNLHVTVTDVHNKGASMRALDSLVDYTAWHFRHEERLMQSNDYPGMAKHKIEHRALISQVNQIQNKFRLDDGNAPAELNTLLKNWLINHIHEVDNLLATFMMTK